jgi:hypothetical protein
VIYLAVWGLVALWGVVIHSRAWLRATRDVVLWRAQGADERAIVMRLNERRRFSWRAMICANNLALALILAVGQIVFHTSALPPWVGLLYLPVTLIANEAIVNLLTHLDERARRRVVEMTHKEVVNRGREPRRRLP